MNSENATAREPEIYREKQVLDERLLALDKSTEELRSEIGQLESALNIALRPAQDKPKAGSNISEPDRASCLTPFGDSMRAHSNTVNDIARRIADLSERLRDIRDRCELPRMPEVAQAMPDSYPGTRDSQKY